MQTFGFVDVRPRAQRPREHASQDILILDEKHAHEPVSHEKWTIVYDGGQADSIARQLAGMASSSRGARDDLVYRVARRLAEARRARGLSQENLADLLGIAAKNLQRIESGKQNLSLATIERICRILDVPAESILGEAPAPRPVRRPDADEATGAALARPRPRSRPVLDRLKDAGFTVRTATERGRRPANAVPVTTLLAAAGYLTGASRAIEIIGWTLLSQRAPRPEGQFVAEVRGHSMEPRIASGSLCLFEPPGPPPFDERIVLVAHTSMVDDELGGPYALKRIESMRKLPHGGTRLTLVSIHPAFAPIVVDSHDDDGLRIIAELVRVLVTGSGEAVVPRESTESARRGPRGA